MYWHVVLRMVQYFFTGTSGMYVPVCTGTSTMVTSLDRDRIREWLVIYWYINGDCFSSLWPLSLNSTSNFRKISQHETTHKTRPARMSYTRTGHIYCVWSPEDPRLKVYCLLPYILQPSSKMSRNNDSSRGAPQHVLYIRVSIASWNYKMYDHKHEPHLPVCDPVDGYCTIPVIVADHGSLVLTCWLPCAS
jgi:hypothetical protein